MCVCAFACMCATPLSHSLLARAGEDTDSMCQPNSRMANIDDMCQQTPHVNTFQCKHRWHVPNATCPLNIKIVKMLHACKINKLKHYDNHCKCNAFLNVNMKNGSEQLFLMLRVLQPQSNWKRVAQHVARSLDIHACISDASAQTVANAVNLRTRMQTTLGNAIASFCTCCNHRLI